MKTPLNKNLFTKNVLSNKRFTEWLPAIRQTPTHKVALGAAGLALAGSAIAGPALAVGSGGHTSPAAGRAATASVNIASARGHVAQAAVSAPANNVDPTVEKTWAVQEAAMPRDEAVNVDYQPQTTYYYCGPAATQIAASARGHDLSQDDIAAMLGTTVNGTSSAVDTTRVLNSIVGSNVYHTTSIPGPPTQAQIDQVQAEVMRSLNDGRVVVGNIAGTTTDVTGATHEFDDGHYIAVVGYHDQGRTVEISDPADENGASSYWISTSNLANWMVGHGYSS